MTPEQDADRLYRLAPEDFTAARDAAARAAEADGDAGAAKALKALRRPSVSAWLVNLLAARQADLVEQLLALGPALAQAQAQGQGEELRALGTQRRQLVDAVTQQAVVLAERPVTAAVRDEVAATLETALADPAAAEAVRSGRLVRALSYAGFGGVDLEGAVATGPAAAAAKKAPPRKAPPKKADAKKAGVERAERIAAAEAAALAAAGRLDDVVRACERAERERAAAETAATQSHAVVDRARQALQDAESAARDADHERISAERASDKAVQAVRRAQSAEQQARDELDRLRRR